MDRRNTPSLCHLGRPLRIAYGRFFHEANTYSPRITDRAAFDNAFFLEGEALARATGLRAKAGVAAVQRAAEGASVVELEKDE